MASIGEPMGHLRSSRSPSQLAAAVVDAEPLSEEKIKEMQRRLDENVDAVRR